MGAVMIPKLGMGLGSFLVPGGRLAALQGQPAHFPECYLDSMLPSGSVLSVSSALAADQLVSAGWSVLRRYAQVSRWIRATRSGLSSVVSVEVYPEIPPSECSAPKTVSRLFGPGLRKYASVNQSGPRTASADWSLSPATTRAGAVISAKPGFMKPKFSAANGARSAPPVPGRASSTPALI